MNVALPGCERELEVRSMKVRDMQLLTDPAKMQNGQALKQILTHCLVTPDIDVEHLLACDCNALLLGIRRATFGDDYDFTAPCPACGQSAPYTMDLAQLEPKPGDRELVGRQLQDPATLHPYTFPECGRIAHFRLCTGTELLTPRGLQATEPLVSALLQRIREVDGVRQSGMPLKVFLRDELSAGDATAFLEHYASVEPGVDDQVQLCCPQCAAPFELALPLEPSGFFRRSKRKTCGKPSCLSPVTED